MRLFIDTEFTDFIDCQLISIGVVSQDGQAFYAERTDYDDAACSAFVRAAVLPKLGRTAGTVGTEAAIARALGEWLARFDAVEVLFDYELDWYLFADLLESSSLPILPRRVNADEVDQHKRVAFYRKNGLREHHALHDAQALMHAFMEHGS